MGEKQPYSELWRIAHNLAQEFQSLPELAAVLLHAKNLEEDIVEFRNKAAQLTTELTELAENINSAKSELGSLDKRLTEQAQTIKQSYIDLENKQRKEHDSFLTELASEVRAAQEKVDAVNQEVRDANSRAQKTIAEYDSQIAEKKKLFDDATAKINELRSKIGG